MAFYGFQYLSIRFAADVGVIITSNGPDEVEIYASEVICTIKSWLEDVELKLAEDKSKLVLFIKPWKQKTIQICIGAVRSQPL